ncbi:MAG: cytochrome c3 family protein [Bacteroidales bacterium]
MKEKNQKPGRRMWMTLGLSAGILIAVSALVTGGVIWHQKPGFCGSCHTPMEAYVADYFAGDSTRMITQHATGDTVFRCVDCHDQRLRQQLSEGVHWISGNYTFPLEDRNLGTRSFCLSSGCHDEAEIIAATSKHNTSFAFSQHDPRHGKQECSSCHSMHGESVYSCNQCHRFDLPEGWIAPQPNGTIAGLGGQTEPS